MILSHRHRFIFIKGIKVAGTSVEIALSQICDDGDIITPITPVDERLRLGTAGEPKNYSTDARAEREYLEQVAEQPVAELRAVKAPKGFENHMSLRDVLERVPQARDYRLIYVERSPYAKVISYANWDANYAAYMSGQSLPTSAESIREALQKTIDDGSFLKVRNIDRYRDGTGQLRSGGWRFKSVAKELADFIHGCGEPPVPMAHVKQGLGSEALDLVNLLTVEQVQRINDAFADEFEIFGYPRLASPALSPAIN